MLTYLESLVSVVLASPLQMFLAALAVVLAFALYLTNQETFRLVDGKDAFDTIFGMVAGAVFGALTGVLWATFNPIQLAPGIHLRLFAFLPCVIGLIIGRGAGFISGYVATIVWAMLSGLFVPFHSPLADGILVGLTGWIPAWLLRGDMTLGELLTKINENRRAWYVKSGLVCLFAGMFMAVFVAISLQATIQLPFETGFGLIGLASDTPPMIICTGLITYALLKATKRSWSWFRTF